MAEFEDKLHAILGDPEAMGQIVSIAKALIGDSASPLRRTMSPLRPQHRRSRFLSP